MAENVAALFLRAKGYEILKQRYKTTVGEIDMIARDGDYLVFIEVKGRASVDEGLFAVTPKMRGRIMQAAEHFLSSFPEHNGKPVRFDVMAVALPFKINHMENAFME